MRILLVCSCCIVFAAGTSAFGQHGSVTGRLSVLPQDVVGAVSLNTPGPNALESSSNAAADDSTYAVPSNRLGVFNILARYLSSQGASRGLDIRFDLPLENQTGIQASQEAIAALSRLPRLSAAAGAVARTAAAASAEDIRNAPFGEMVLTTPPGTEASRGPDGVNSLAPSMSDPLISGDDGELMPGKTPLWAGQPIEHVKKQATDTKVPGELPIGTITSLEDLSDLTDDQLYQVFTMGVADIPGSLPGSAGNFTFCTGKPLVNAFTDSGWPRGSWSAHEMSPINNAVQRIWRGKVFYQDPETQNTQLWNLFWSNSTVAVIGNISVMDPGMSKDGKPSAIIDYASTESILFRALRDEMRRVGPNIWLGRAWFVDPVDNWVPNYPNGPPQGSRSAAALKSLNNTVLRMVEAVGFEGPNSTPTSSGGYYPTVGEPLAILYFAMDCIQDGVPKLYYTMSSRTEAAISSATGYVDPQFTLPVLNSEAGSNAVESWEDEYPVSTNGRYTEPFILYPWKFSDVGPYGYVKVPARFFEPVFGAWWLYDYRKNAENQIRSPGTAVAQDAIEFPVREIAQTVATPVMDPLVRGVDALRSTRVSPFAVQQALGLPVRAP
eukprot:jgi/Botrbrau1/2806/Bobra.0125s0017.1